MSAPHDSPLLERDTPLRVAHLLRPSAGGMREQVRSLLGAPGVSPLLAAPEDVLAVLADSVPDAQDRWALAIDGAPDPREMLQRGRAAGQWASGRGAVLLHGHGLRLAPLFATASLAGRLPLVVTLHNLVPSLSPPRRVAARLALGRAAAVIAVSDAVARSAHGIAGGTRVTVVRNGIDTERFRPADTATRAAARRALGLDAASPAVLCVARLAPEKGVDTFLEAAALVVRDLPGTRFLVAGDGSLLPTLRWQRRFLDLEGRVHFLGRRDDVPTLLAAADLLCIPSREEGLGLAALEAMGVGLPVVATRVGGLPEVITPGETGLLSPPSDPPALAAAIAEMLAAPERARRMGLAGRARVETDFTLANMREATLRVYREALRR